MSVGKIDLQFNPAQLEAIAHPEGPMLVLAGPGSGKTSVIVARCARLIRKEKIPASRILVVTFSRLAAEGMKKRFLRHIGADSTQAVFGTFHSTFFGILSQAYGLGPDNILTEEEKVRLLRTLLIENGMDQAPEEDFIREILGEISTVKENRVSIEHYHSVCCPDDLFQTVYRAYVQTNRLRRKLDFDDMLTDCYDLFVRRPDILAFWRERFSWIMVDEFQDINPLQYDILRMLAAPADNLFVVGDDDQSIYRFRGASPDIMLHFEKDFPAARRVVLGVNYRCSGNILETAVQVIEHNRKRFQKDLSTPNPQGPPVGISIFRTPPDEYRHIAAEMVQRMEKGEDPGKTAVLFRTNQEAEGLVREFLDRQIPFFMREELPNLFAHWISRDILSYLEMAEEYARCGYAGFPRNLFLRVMNRPNRYISRAACAFAGNNSGMGDAVMVDAGKLLLFYRDKDWMQERVRRLGEDMRMLAGLPPFAAVDYVRRSIGYDAFLSEYAGEHRQRETDLLRIPERLQESARSVPSLTVWKKDIEAYGQKLKEQAGRQREEAWGVTLATLHAVKGLEFDNVFICNVNEETIPFRKALLPEALEEERRLFYVGMTRARERLTLCFVRRQFDSPRMPSRFLAEAGMDST